MKRARNNNPRNPREESQWHPCYCAGAGPRLTALMSGMCQGPVFDHFRTASVEMLLGFRALLDAQIEALRRESRKGVKVRVE